MPESPYVISSLKRYSTKAIDCHAVQLPRIYVVPTAANLKKDYRISNTPNPCHSPASITTKIQAQNMGCISSVLPLAPYGIPPSLPPNSYLY